MQIIINKSVDKELNKISKGNKNLALKIKIFLYEVLTTTKNPTSLPNAKKLQGYENYYRWRIGDYRIIGILEREILTIEIIKIANRQEAYKP